MTQQDITLPKDISRPLRNVGLAVIFASAALVIWTTSAPLATTIRLSGTIVSSAQSVDIQHPYGGQISDVLVTTHDEITQGSTLLYLDTTLDEGNLATYRAMHDRLLQENKVIAAILTDRIDGLADKERAIGASLILRAQQAEVQSDLRLQAAQNLGVQIDAIDRKLAQNTAQIAQLEARADRHARLLQRGIMARDNGEALQERIMIVSGDLASEEAKRAGLVDQRNQQVKQAELIRLALRQELSATRDRNVKQIRELSLQIRQLRDVIERATVTAPIAGVVTDVVFQAQGMYAGRGQTILTLAQPLHQPYLKFAIPTHQIDQVRPGMRGRFTLLALNQRNLPRLDLVITAISPRAQTDENDAPRSYIGRADIDSHAMQMLKSALGEDIALSEDMPVELLIEGRTITAAQYLLEPLQAAFDHAIQD